MADVMFPETADAVAVAVAEAYAAGRTLEIIGGGSRRGYGSPVFADVELNVSGLAGVVDYQPDELVLTAKPGTMMIEIQALVATRGQALAFEPPDLAPLWGGQAGAGTLGGCIATGLSGPRRIHAGAARDHLLGFAAVNGRGETFSAGGKVLKNVTGFDLPKLLTGSMGTLAVLTEVTVKVLPAAPDVLTLELPGLTVAEAVTAMRVALAGGVAVTGAAHLPWDGGRTLLRLEGAAQALAAQAVDLERRLSAVARRVLRLETAQSRMLWADIGAVSALRETGSEWIWRLALPAGAAVAVLARLADVPGLRWQIDWGGALIWLSHPDPGDAPAPDVRAALAGIEGAHATLVRAPAAARASAPALHPVAPAVAALSARVQSMFDPGRVFNPGRMGEGD